MNSQIVNYSVMGLFLFLASGPLPNIPPIASIWMLAILLPRDRNMYDEAQLSGRGHGGLTLMLDFNGFMP